MTDHLIYELRDGVATITLNRPEVLNALSAELTEGLADTLEGAAEDENVRAIIITGAGRAFSAGQNLDEIRGDYEDGGKPDFKAILKTHHRAVSAIRNMQAPVIAAVNGVAAGAGMSYVCACDIRIAADSARFTTAFAKIGLVPDVGMASTLPRLVGYGKAVELCLTSDVISAEQALAIGLVNEVVPADELQQKAADLAARFAAGPTYAYGLIKQLMAAGVEDDFEDLLEAEADLQDEAGGTEDHKAAVAAFLAKQPPVFSGR
ncbi:MAG: hypothetical protein GEU28_04635 [Dehalococcoidia bacterium]|nr:hypothetical protein [Dehalococcoidia bacterium]